MKTLVIFLSLSFSGCISASSEPIDKHPNIIFFLIDDIRNTSLGCYGHPIIQTPNMDSLSSHGTRFTNAFVTTPICAASRASILTGLYESTYGYTFGKPPIIKDQADDCFPKILKEKGYRTGFIGKWGVETESDHKEYYHTFLQIDRSPYMHVQKDGSLRHEAELCGDAAISFIEEQKKEGPFCLQVSFNSVHAEDMDKENQFPVPKAVEGLYADVTIPEPRLADPAIFEKMPAFLKNSMNRQRYFWRWDTPEKYQKNMKAYFRMITGVDNVIGRVLKALKKNELDKNTIIIAGDNGYYMGDRGFAGKWSHFEESLRIPLIIYDPRWPVPQQNDQLALNIDLPPTILGLANISPPVSYQGSSLLPLIKGEKDGEWRTSFLIEHQMDHKDIPKWIGVRDQRYVYAHYYEQSADAEFLHDLEIDGDQLVNFVADPKYAQILKEMRSKCRDKKEFYLNPR